MPKPDAIRRRCNYHCRLEWKIAGRGECNESCGHGLQNLTYKCIKIIHDNSIATVLDTYCLKELNHKPNKTVPCEGLCEGVQWSFGEWTSCSKTCGGGEQTRTVKCYHAKSGKKMDDSKCGEKKTNMIMQSCNIAPCPQWHIGDWSPCSVSCGIGMKERQFWCKIEDRQVDNRLCNEMKIPHHRQECIADKQCGRWTTYEWSQCSSNCGPGIRSRDVQCINMISEKIISESNCDKTQKPSNSSTCIELLCNKELGNMDKIDEDATKQIDAVNIKKNDIQKRVRPNHRHRHSRRGFRNRHKNDRYQYNLPRYRWKIGRWEKCSKKCGGVQERVVACYDRVKGRIEPDKSRCAQVRATPRDTQHCNSDCSPGAWSIGQWSQCSSSCGPGVKWRQVQCIDKESGAELPHDRCDVMVQPLAEETCVDSEMCSRPVLQVKFSQMKSDIQSYVWRQGDWSQCSATCGGGHKFRQVQCFDIQGTESSLENCPTENKPTSQDYCNQEPCPSWNFGQWSNCDR